MIRFCALEVAVSWYFKYPFLCGPSTNYPQNTYYTPANTESALETYGTLAHLLGKLSKEEYNVLRGYFAEKPFRADGFVKLPQRVGRILQRMKDVQHLLTQMKGM